MSEIAFLQDLARRLRENVAQVIVGKDEVVDQLLVALFCEGHVLLEDVPGIGKTMLAKTLAASLGISFQRIQFTPDLLPSDIVGVSVYNRKTDDFEYRPGPILAGIVLADEINRAGPRTQSAMLEAMEERHVTVDGISHALPYPFFLMATQNPVELAGTFPLPEAQMDRFLIQVAIGYPQREEERQILHRFRSDNPLDRVQSIVQAEEIRRAVTVCRNVFVHHVLEDYLLDLVQATRADSALELGVSPRGSLAFYRTAQAYAAIRGRSFVTPDDIQQLAAPVLRHRLIPAPDTRLHGTSVARVLDGIVDSVPVPVEENWQESASRGAVEENEEQVEAGQAQAQDAAESPQTAALASPVDGRSTVSG
jgi:MoxR-like ATPase